MKLEYRKVDVMHTHQGRIVKAKGLVLLMPGAKSPDLDPLAADVVPSSTEEAINKQLQLGLVDVNLVKHNGGTKLYTHNRSNLVVLMIA